MPIFPYREVATDINNERLGTKVLITKKEGKISRDTELLFYSQSKGIYVLEQSYISFLYDILVNFFKYLNSLGIKNNPVTKARVSNFNQISTHVGFLFGIVKRKLHEL